MSEFNIPHRAVRIRDGLACVETWVHDARNCEYGYMSPRHDWYTLDNYLRLNYYVVPDVPRYQLPEDVPCTPTYRKEFNAWALTHFGYDCAVPDDQVQIGADPYRRGGISQRAFDTKLAYLTEKYGRPPQPAHEPHPSRERWREHRRQQGL